MKHGTTAKTIGFFSSPFICARLYQKYPHQGNPGRPKSPRYDSNCMNHPSQCQCEGQSSRKQSRRRHLVEHHEAVWSGRRHEQVIQPEKHAPVLVDGGPLEHLRVPECLVLHGEIRALLSTYDSPFIQVPQRLQESDGINVHPCCVDGILSQPLSTHKLERGLSALYRSYHDPSLWAQDDRSLASAQATKTGQSTAHGKRRT